MKAIQQYVHVVVFVMLSKVVLTFKLPVLLSSSFPCYCLYAVQSDFNFLYTSVDETVVCDHSNESYCVVLSCGAVYYAVQGGSNFQVCG